MLSSALTAFRTVVVAGRYTMLCITAGPEPQNHILYLMERRTAGESDGCTERYDSDPLASSASSSQG